jgi:L-ascorbate metabolism protein UlaG (beta-lactamase superfamily)
MSLDNQLCLQPAKEFSEGSLLSVRGLGRAKLLETGSRQIQNSYDLIKPKVTNRRFYMKLKWYGTATILLEQDGTSLLFDPFLSLSDKGYRPSVDELAVVEHVLVTHGHLDHIIHIPDIIEHSDGKTMVYCTAKPREVLISKGVDGNRIHEVKPEDVLQFAPFEVRVLNGKHIVFDSRLIIKKLLNPRILTTWNSARYLLKENKICVEAGETVVYDISVADQRILLFGSLNLDDQKEYPTGTDLLILPFQGRSDITKYAVSFIERLQPKRVLLDHYDDTFPPISSEVSTGRFISVMRQKHPDIPIICTQAGAEWIEV